MILHIIRYDRVFILTRIISKRIRDLDYRLIVSVDGSYSTADENLSAFFKEVEMDSGGPGGLWIRENNEVIDNYHTGVLPCGRLSQNLPLNTRRYMLCTSGFPCNSDDCHQLHP